VVTDPVVAGAVRAAEATGRLLGSWRTAPLQALARLHVLAAVDLAGDPDAELGRPVRGAERLALLADLVTGGSAAPAPVLVAVVHGELLAVEPFPSANGVVARAAARLAAIGSGLDPRGLAVPEVGHLRAGAAYREAAHGFATGTPDGLAEWIRHCCDQWVAGAREGDRRPPTRLSSSRRALRVVIVASASSVPVRRPTTTCLPRRAVRGAPDRHVRSPEQGGRVLLCRTAPGRPGVRGFFVVGDAEHNKGRRPVHRFRHGGWRSPARGVSAGHAFGGWSGLRRVLR
jgi:hypothetical protein